MKQRVVDLSELARIEQDAKHVVFVDRSGRRSVDDGIDHVVDRDAR